MIITTDENNVPMDLSVFMPASFNRSSRLSKPFSVAAILKSEVQLMLIIF